MRDPVPHFEQIEKLPSFCILDGAQLEGRFAEARRLAKDAVSLYRDPPEKEMEQVGPFLAPFTGGSEFARWFFESGWGHSLGILARSGDPVVNVYRHFRRFLIVQDEEGRQLYFRFYDPRVLRVFLPTCSLHQLRDLFGPVSTYICEDENPGSAVLFSLQDGRLLREVVDLTSPGGRRPAQVREHLGTKGDVIV